jgi:dTDP-4-dehydrorhamnose 3,5-epimerase|tara:strand:- start:1496 stop:2059 length:564 start_codon:yes stop_codon:yes gene_type:complete
MLSKFINHNTPINDLHVIERNPIIDDRGFLERLFCSSELDIFLNNKQIKQINRTLTKKKGSVRGLHFQNSPYAEKKIITCLKGSVFDIAIDLRKNSSTFLQWHAEILSEENLKSFIIPEGFAHGFQTTSDDVEMLYFHTNDYSSKHEDALNINDPLLNIKLPLNISDISVRDDTHLFINKKFKGIKL